jgi:signal transduction histidine kinase
MSNGGKRILETGSAYLDENYSRTNDDIRPGRYALIAVSDTGTGIPAAILDKVFDPLLTSKGPGKGTGLGLSMVNGFIKQSAGHIKISSEGAMARRSRCTCRREWGRRRFPKASPSLRSKAVTRRSLSSRTTGW